VESIREHQRCSAIFSFADKKLAACIDVSISWQIQRGVGVQYFSAMSKKEERRREENERKEENK
jgi:hypothetical protein